MGWSLPTSMGKGCSGNACGNTATKVSTTRQLGATSSRVVATARTSSGAKHPSGVVGCQPGEQSATPRPDRDRAGGGREPVAGNGLEARAHTCRCPTRSRRRRGLREAGAAGRPGARQAVNPDRAPPGRRRPQGAALTVSDPAKMPSMRCRTIWHSSAAVPERKKAGHPPHRGNIFGIAQGRFHRFVAAAGGRHRYSRRSTPSISRSAQPRERKSRCREASS